MCTRLFPCTGCCGTRRPCAGHQQLVSLAKAVSVLIRSRPVWYHSGQSLGRGQPRALQVQVIPLVLVFVLALAPPALMVVILLMVHWFEGLWG